MLFKTKIVKEPVDVPQSELGKGLVQYVQAFKKGEKDIIPNLFFLVKEEETHATFYSVSFGIQEGDAGEDNYYDVFLGSYVLDYTSPTHRLIEIEDDHEVNFSFSSELYETLQSKPCYTLDSLKEHGFIHYFSNGFPARESTIFQENVEQL